MPKVIKLDGMKPGEYGLAFKDAMQSALKKYRFDMAGLDNYLQWYNAELARIKNDEQFLTIVCRMDAGEAAFFARQLEYVKARTYDILYPEYLAQYWLPVSNEAGPGAESITWRQYDQFGRMALISKRGQDLPRVDIAAKETSYPIKSWGEAYGYTIQEIRNAQYAGVPLEQRKANAARLAYEQTVNELGWFANGAEKFGGVRGLLYLLDVLNTTTDNIEINGNWCTSDGQATETTPDQIISDIGTILMAPVIRSKNIEKPNTFLMPLAAFGYISKTRVSSVSDTTILEFVKSVNPGVTFGGVNELAGDDLKGVAKPSGGSGKTAVAIAYNKNPDKLVYEIPQPFEQFPVEVRGLEYVIPCHCRIAGVNAFYPKSVIIAEGVQGLAS
jgi:hypothetical protein